MITLTEVRDYLKRVSYQDWCLEARESGEFIKIFVHYSAPDALVGLDAPRETFASLLQVHAEALTSEQLPDLVYSTVRGMAVHEFNEWFKVDGVALHYPHAVPTDHQPSMA